MKKIFKIQKSNTSFFIHISEPLVGNDVNSYCINIEFDEELQDAQLIICAMRADGEIITDSAIITGREALYTLKNNMYSVPGEVNIRLRVVNGGMMLTEKQLIFTALEGYGEGSTADDRLPVLENLIVEAQKATAEAREAAERVPEMEGDIRENTSAIEAIDKSLENGLKHCVFYSYSVKNIFNFPYNSYLALGLFMLGRKLGMSNEGWLKGKGCKLISKPQTLPRELTDMLQK